MLLPIFLRRLHLPLRAGTTLKLIVFWIILSKKYFWFTFFANSESSSLTFPNEEILETSESLTNVVVSNALRVRDFSLTIWATALSIKSLSERFIDASSYYLNITLSRKKLLQ